MAVYDGPNLGSEEHADRLWQMATDLLRYLNKPLEGGIDGATDSGLRF